MTTIVKDIRDSKLTVIKPLIKWVGGKTKIIDKISTTELILNKEVPDTFTVYNTTRVVSNAEYCLLMFHFVDHLTRDVEAAQYWSHEFTFWVQAWVDRQGEPAQYEGVVQDISITGELLPDENIVFED
jgi:hypothetical protein